QGFAVLRGAPPRTTSATAQKTSGEAGAADRRTDGRGLISLRGGFWRVGFQPFCGTLRPDAACCPDELKLFPLRILQVADSTLPLPHVAGRCVLQTARKRHGLDHFGSKCSGILQQNPAFWVVIVPQEPGRKQRP